MMDDLEELSVDIGELESTFDSAAKYLQELAATLSSEKLLFFYARYKQVNDGPCNTSKPGFFDFKGKQKWEAWKSLQDMTKDNAMKEYIDGINEIDPDWQLNAPSEGRNLGGGSWVKVSTLAPPKKEKDGDTSDGSREDSSESDGEGESVFNWVKENNLHQIQSAEKETLQEKDGSGMTLLHWAADRGYLEMSQLLLAKGLDINGQDADRQTALHYAASCGHKNVIEVLLSHGADVTVKDSDGLTALDCADGDIKALFN